MNATQKARAYTMRIAQSGNCPACRHAGDKVMGTRPFDMTGSYVYFCADHSFDDLVQEFEYAEMLNKQNED